ncbi:hypothetical protein K7432_004612 [Basidiobolus ranarum]|uniref:Uncharacterized protein n=1 Tax=Basidiobolus ranarum TaxID=34480 RepID=A0ABR2W4C0_9FUNG
MRSGWPPSSNAESSPTSSRGRQRRRRYLLGLLDNIVSSEKYHLTWSSQPDRDVMNPQWWGTVEFLDTTTSQAIVDSEYSARYFLNILYQLEQNHFESFGTYSEDLSMLMPNTTIFKECSFDKPVIEVHDGGMRFDIHLKLDDHKTGHISQDRLLWFS